MSAEPMGVECPECGRLVAVVSSPDNVWAALRHHTCTTAAPNERKPIMSTPSMHSVPAVPKRPHPRELVAHDDPRIARAAKKVVDALAKLDAAWEANAAKAELRARQRELEAELAKVKAQIKGTAPAPAAAPKVDYKAVRAWADANGIEVPKVGRIGADIVDAYNQAHGGGAA